MIMTRVSAVLPPIPTVSVKVLACKLCEFQSKKGKKPPPNTLCQELGGELKKPIPVQDDEQSLIRFTSCMKEEALDNLMNES